MSAEGGLEILEAEDRELTAVVRLRGVLDIRTAPEFLQRVAAIQGRGQNLVLNLSEVTFIGSSGIGALLAIAEQFREQSGQVRFAAPSQAVMYVIKVLNLGEFLMVDDSEADSLEVLEG
jgi:anti-sigma B factor antagonist